MDDDTDLPWWQTSLKGLGILLGLVLLSGLLMGIIILVARFFDRSAVQTSIPAPIIVDVSEQKPQQNARTRVPQPYPLQPWPDTPSPRTGTGPSPATPRPQSGGVQTPGEKKAEVPVGISVEAYQEAIAEGKKIFLPNPQGDCSLSGTGADKSARGLEECFAARAAR